MAAVSPVVSAQSLPPFTLKCASYAVSKDGALLGYLAEPHRVTIRAKEEVPRHFIDALLATEDRDFYTHGGVSLKSLGRALLNTLRGKVEGGSTITMQLARNLYLSNERTISRKMEEIELAGLLEKRYPKDSILVLYLNTVYFGRGAYGIWAAAQEYFSTTPDRLSVPESALLVGLLKAPAAYDPVKYPGKALARRNEVLHNLVEVGKISEKTYRELAGKPLGLKLRKYPSRSVLEFIRIETASVLRSLGRSPNATPYKITATVDPIVQEAMEKAVESRWRALASPLKEAQVGIACVEVGTGAVCAMVGGAPGSDPRGLNRAVQARRQPGSAFKPFLYGSLLENGFTLATPIPDTPVVVDSGTVWEWRPNNDDDRWSGTEVPMIEGIRKSLNLVAVQAMVKFSSPAVVAEFARRCGISSPLQEYPSLALGTSEVTPLEMASAFAVFASCGKRASAFSVARIEDLDGRTLYTAAPDTTTVLDSSIAFLVTTALASVVDSGTADAIRAVYHGPAAGKTGTTQLSTDAWFVGYTPRLSAAIWIGFDDPSRRLTGQFRYGGTACAPVWAEAFASIARKTVWCTDTAFAVPSTVSYVNLCRESGLLAGPNCIDTLRLPIDATRPPRECDRCASPVPH
ncbi:MAG: transglycosylase domain-containing protein [Bacteroidota bacterium]|nr:transglycosylase domain-containing protein [Bacteroidota bacterium]